MGISNESPWGDFMAAMALTPRQVGEYSDESLDEFSQICWMHLDTPATITHGHDSDGWTVKELRDARALALAELASRREW